MTEATARQLRRYEPSEAAERADRDGFANSARSDRAPQRRLRLVGPASGPADYAEYEPTYAENGRRTVTITGHPVAARPRSSAPISQIQARPDRIALWAVLLGFFLVFMAVATAGAATV